MKTSAFKRIIGVIIGFAAVFMPGCHKNDVKSAADSEFQNSDPKQETSNSEPQSETQPAAQPQQMYLDSQSPDEVVCYYGMPAEFIEEDKHNIPDDEASENIRQYQQLDEKSVRALYGVSPNMQTK